MSALLRLEIDYRRDCHGNQKHNNNNSRAAVEAQKYTQHGIDQPSIIFIIAPVLSSGHCPPA
jgi:hypothetical protein